MLPIEQSHRTSPTDGTLDTAYPYESAAFHQCWWNALAPKFDIPLKNKELLIHRKSMAKGLFVLKEMRVSGWNSAWSQDLTTARVLELDELGKATDWDYFRIKWNENRQDRQALDLLAEKGYQTLQLPAPVDYIMDLQDGFENYLKSLSHNGRTSLKKKFKRSQPLNPQRVVYSQESDIEPFFSEFFLHHLAYWDTKMGSYFHSAEERRFIVEWAKALHASGQLILERLLLNGETANLCMGIRTGSTYYFLLTINTGIYKEFVPGLISLYLRTRDLAEQGVTRINLGAGDYFYKVQSANSREVCQDLLVINPRSLRGRAYAFWLKQKLKKALSNAATPGQ